MGQHKEPIAHRGEAKKLRALMQSNVDKAKNKLKGKK